jgi:hypothetical protein
VIALSALPRLVAWLLVLWQILPPSAQASASTGLSAYAVNRGDVAAWQACDLQPGISVTFTPNPSYALPNKQGIIADRARLSLHVNSSVPPGDYLLIFLSYSFYQSGIGEVVIEYLPHLRVLADHSIRFPAFSQWGSIDAADAHAVTPVGPCTRLPDTNV